MIAWVHMQNPLNVLKSSLKQEKKLIKSVLLNLFYIYYLSMSHSLLRMGQCKRYEPQ